MRRRPLRTSVRAILLLVTLVLVAASSELGASAGTPATESDWPQPLYNAGRTNSNSVESQLGPPEVASLELVSEVRLSDQPAGTPMVVDGDFIAYVRAGTDFSEDLGFDYRLTRVDGATGKVLWRNFDSNCVHVPPHVTNDVVVAGSTGCSQSDPGGQYAVDSSTGGGRWYEFSHTRMYAVHEGRVFFAHGPYGGYDDVPLVLKAVDASTGARLWRKALTDRGDLLATGSTLYMRVGSRVVARSVFDGSVTWKVLAPSGGQLDVATPGVLYFQAGGSVIALSTVSREVLWQAPGRLDAVLRNQALLGTAAGLEARSAMTGALLWTNTSYFSVQAAADGVVYSRDQARQTIVALRASDGAFLDSVIGGTATVANGRLYVTTGRVIRGYA